MPSSSRLSVVVLFALLCLVAVPSQGQAGKWIAMIPEITSTDPATLAAMEPVELLQWLLALLGLG